MPGVVSSAISKVSYDAGSRQLQIWFVGSGGPYVYYGVPQAIYDGLMASPSKGTYFNLYIRDQYSINR